jgi:subtilisin-like proprotein convertase family protein
MRTRTRAIGIAALASGAIAIAASGAPAAPRQFKQPAGARPQLDVRAGQRAHVPGATHAARTTLARQLGIEGVVVGDPVGGGLRSLVRTDGFLTGPRPGGAGGPATIALAFVRAHATAFGMSARDLAALRLVSRTRSNHGAAHLIWVPYVDGIPAYDSQLKVHLTADGRVIAASGPPLGGLSIASAAPRLSPSRALAAAQRDVGAPASLPAADTQPGPQQATTFSDGDRASLVVFDAPSGDRLAWRVIVAGRHPYLYEDVVDADSGQVLVRHSLTDFASSAHVFFYHPGAAAGGTATQVDLAPYLTSSTTLSGPNAHAYADPDDETDPNTGQETQGTPVEVGPSSGTDWEYPQTQNVPPGTNQHCAPFGGLTGICTWDGATTTSELVNRDQVTTQVFWLVNNFHDWLKAAPVGFDDASHNFEVGGTGGSDPVDAESDDSIDSADPQLDNANMSTPPDGQSPTMQMYLFNAPFPAVNGGDDASVVYHEYTHGLSNRLVDPVNAAGLDADQSGAMGEAWSDWYAMDYLVAHGLVTDTATDGQVVVGEYATGDPVHGIREQALDCAVDSPAAACGGSPNAGHAGGFTYADLGHVTGYDASTPAFEVHADGEIWSETLWDLRTALGATTARMLITEALRMSPPNPSFLDERDAILAADQLDDGGAHHDQIWQIFAVRGMGFGAQTTSANATRGVADFTTPQLAASFGAFADDSGPLGDGDGTPEPGEALRLDVPVADPGLASLTHVHGTLMSGDPNVFVGRADADYGTIAGGDFQDPATPFTVTLNGGLQCGEQVPFTLHVTSDQGAIDLPLVIDLGSGRSASSSSDGAHAIPDGHPTTGTSSTITVPTGGRIDALRVTVNISHTFVGDLTATLRSPGGKTIDLLERPGFGGFGSDAHWLGPVTFEDDAFDSIQEIGTSTDLPGGLTGPYVPDEPLAAFAGKDRAGTWTLHVTDAVGGDAGTLNDWSLDTDQPACDAQLALPAPATGDATAVTTGGATLTGTLGAGGAQTQGVFEYGASASYGQTAPAGSVGGGGSAPVAAAVAGLAPGTTYHYRLDALRGGELVAVGADRTFTTTAAASTLAGKPGAAAPHVSRVPRRLTLDRRNRFTFTFIATPAGLRGTVKFVLPKHGHSKALTLATARFTTTRGGRVKIVVTLRGAGLRRLKALHGAKLKVTISLGGKRFGSTLRLSLPKPARKRR